MGQPAIFAGLYVIMDVYKISAAFVPQEIKRAKAEDTIKTLSFKPLMAREILTSVIFKIFEAVFHIIRQY